MQLITRGARRKSAAHLFLSHSSKDKASARQIATDLTLCGVDAWLDDWEIRIGQSLPDVLADAMAKSKYIAILMTENYNTSVWTKTEFNKALIREQNEGRIVMLPLLLRGNTIPDFIQEKVYLDLRSEYFAGIVRLVAAVHDLPESRISRVLESAVPKSIADVWTALDAIGFESSILLESEDFNEILSAGGEMAGPDYAHFDPEAVLRNPGVSEPVKALITRLIAGNVPRVDTTGDQNPPPGNPGESPRTKN